MDVLMFAVALVLLVPLAVTLLLRRTRFAWLPGLLLFAGAFATLAANPPEPHDSVSGWAALFALVLLAAAMITMTAGIAVSSLRRTWWYWLPGAALVALGVVAYCVLSHDLDDVTYPTPTVAGIFEVARLGLLGLGIAYVGFGAWLRRRSEPPPGERLPSARVVGTTTSKP